MKPIDRLLDIMARLRAPDGCPWDQEQSLDSLKPYLLEEAHEVLEAIDEGDIAAHCDELGDLLLQVVFQSQIRAEAEEFNFDDVATSIADKLVRRHPHVFGDTIAETSEVVLRNWEQIKREEKAAKAKPGETPEPESILDNVTKGIPALMYAQEVQKKAAKVGFDWPDATGPMLKIREEVQEVEEAVGTDKLDELGDLLFAVVNLVRHQGASAEVVLLKATKKFETRFRAVEASTRAAGQSLGEMSLAELDKHWDAAKSNEATQQREQIEPPEG